MQASVLFKTTARNVILRFSVCAVCIQSGNPTPSSSDKVHFPDQVGEEFILSNSRQFIEKK